MVTLSAPSGNISSAPINPHTRHDRVRRVTGRAAFGLSLVAAALLGAVAANQWGPVTTHHPPAATGVVGHRAPAPLSLPAPAPPARAALAANGANGLADGAWT